MSSKEFMCLNGVVRNCFAAGLAWTGGEGARKGSISRSSVSKLYQTHEVKEVSIITSR